jgi:putative FmdB family regulatory protein
MPIYEYKCRGCGNCIEALIRSSSPSTPDCPACQGEDLEQLLSTFAASTEAASKAAFSVARRQTEKGLRDQRIAQQQEFNDHH